MMASNSEDSEFWYRNPSTREQITTQVQDLSVQQVEGISHDLVTPFTSLLRPKSQINYRVLAEYLGRVVYNEPSLLCHFAVYWAEQAGHLKIRRCKSSEMVVDAEGVILNRCLTLDRDDAYYYPAHYKRMRRSYNEANEALKASSISERNVSIGQFGTVYHAVDIASDRRGSPLRFAEKVIPLHQFNKNELEILCTVEHKHIVQVYGAIRTKDGIHIFMHLAAGGSVARLIKKGCGLPYDGNTCPHLFTEYWGMTYFSQILSALCYLKENNIVHCDVKPRNVALSSNCTQCFLLDFGEALIVPKGQDFVQLKSGIVGTEHFMSPEVIENLMFYYQSDLWSAACFLLNVLTGYTPWTISFTGLATYLYAITRKPYKIIEEIPDWTHSLTKSLLKSCFVEIHKRKHVEEVFQLSKKAVDIIKEKYKQSKNNVSHAENAENSQQSTNVLSENEQQTTNILHESDQQTTNILHESNQQTTNILHESYQQTTNTLHESNQQSTVWSQTDSKEDEDQIKFEEFVLSGTNGVVQPVVDRGCVPEATVESSNDKQRDNMDELDKLLEEHSHLIDGITIDDGEMLDFDSIKDIDSLEINDFALPDEPG